MIEVHMQRVLDLEQNLLVFFFVEKWWQELQPGTVTLRNFEFGELACVVLSAYSTKQR